MMKRLWLIPLFAVCLLLFGCAKSPQTAPAAVQTPSPAPRFEERAADDAYAVRLYFRYLDSGYLAAEEWHNYLEEYNSKPENEDDIAGTRPKFPAEYDMYNLRSQEMKDALDKILHKYDLKPAGAEMPFRTPAQLLRALDMENVLRAGSGAEMQVLNANYYENGNLDFEFDITIPGEGELLPEETWGGLYYRRKDCLIPDVAKLRDKDSWREWNYTTAAGNP